MRIKLLFFIQILFFANTLLANQEIKQDSLSTLSPSQLLYTLKKQKDLTYKKKLACKYIKSAKEDNDPTLLAEVYYAVSESYSHSKNAVLYADSLIQLSKNLSDKSYLAKGYLQKGIQLYYIEEHHDALKNFLKANELYVINKDELKQLVIRHYIGLLKNKTDESKEAFKIFKENMTFFKSPENREKYKQQYLKSLFALSNAYLLEGELDSARYYSEEGIRKSLSTADRYLYPHFLLSYGGAKMLQKEYEIALDSMIKGTSMIRDKKVSLSMNYLHISNSYDSIGNKQKSILYLKKIDSIYQKDSQVILQARNAYENLLRKYQEDNNTEMQIIMIKKLLSVDSILRSKPSNLSKQIVEKYDTPNLIFEKERIINDLKRQKQKESFINWFLILFAILLLIGIIYIGRRNIINKKRFKAVLENKNNTIDDNKSIEISNKEDLDLPDHIVTSLLNKLEEFEKSRKFINKQYTLSLLAKEFNTNNGYLSKIINSKKKTSFSQYINNLRIDYAVMELSKSPKLRSYTIKAIAKEFGFNTAQSFTTAFHKNTGIYPSYFLKQLKNQGDNTEK